MAVSKLQETKAVMISALLWKYKQPLLLILVLAAGALNLTKIESEYRLHEHAAWALGACFVALVVTEVIYLNTTRKYLPGHTFGDRFVASRKDRYGPFAAGVELALIPGALLSSFTRFYHGILPDMSWYNWVWALAAAAGIGWAAKMVAKSRRRTQSVESFARGFALGATGLLLVIKLFELSGHFSPIAFGLLAIVMLSLAWLASELYDSEAERHRVRTEIRAGERAERRQVNQKPPHGIDYRSLAADEEDGDDLEDTQSMDYSSATSVSEELISDQGALKALLAKMNLSYGEANELLQPNYSLQGLGEAGYTIAVLESALQQFRVS